MFHEMVALSLGYWHCTKKVRAGKITAIEETKEGALLTVDSTKEGVVFVNVDNSYMLKHKPYIGGYFVLYKGGYASFSPSEPFEEGYVLDNTTITDKTGF